jgi:hypothetical protein
MTCRNQCDERHRTQKADREVVHAASG